MYQRKDGIWCDTLPRAGKSPKFFYGKTKGDVKRKMAEWQAEQEAGIKLFEACDAFLSYKEKQVRYNTYNAYLPSIDRARDYFGDIPLKSITAKDVQTYVKYYAAQGWKKSTMVKLLDTLSMVCEYQIINGNLAANPCEYVKLPNDLHQERRNIPDRSIIDTVKACVNLEFGLFAYMLIYTGLRRGELLALTNDDIDLQSNVIHVRKGVTFQEGGKPVVAAPKTATSVRDIPILKPLRDHIPTQFNGYLFSLDGGKTPLSSAEFFRLWRSYCRAAGLYDYGQYCSTEGGKTRMIQYKRCTLSPHQLRHEFATICFDAGLDPLDAADLLGHSSDRTTREVYTHIKESRKEKTIQKLSDYVDTAY